MADEEDTSDVEGQSTGRDAMPIQAMGGEDVDTGEDVGALEQVGEKLQNQYRQPQADVESLRLSELLKNPPLDAVDKNKPIKLSELLKGYEGDRPNWPAVKIARELLPDWMHAGNKELTAGERLWVKTQPFYKIASAFGHGYEESYKQGISLEPETVEALKRVGVWDGVNESEDIAHKTFMDGTFIPAVRSLYEATRQTYVTPLIVGGAQLANIPITTYMSAPFEGAISAAAEAGQELKEKGIGTGTELPAAVEWFGTTAEGLGAIKLAAVPDVVVRAKAEGIIEGGETGAKVRTPEQEAEIINASKIVAETESAKPPEPDIHQVARSVAPDVFKEFDDLSKRKEVLGNWLRRFSQDRLEAAKAEAPHTQEIADLTAKLETANQRKTKIYSARLAELTAANDAWIAEKVKEDTPDIAQTREKYQEADYRMRDLSPQVSAAYREAEARMPKGAEPPVEPVHAKSEPEFLWRSKDADYPIERLGDVHTFEDGRKYERVKSLLDNTETYVPADEIVPAKAEATSPVGKPIEEQLNGIREDVKKNLVSVGRPEDEATASAELIASHYQAVADQGWAKGTPEEIYQRHMAEIKAGRNKARVLAQGEQEFGQKTKGKIRLGVDGARNIISLFKTADASTFIHELGHHWLEEMMSFASDKDAPQSIKNHVDTVRNWMGLKEGDEIAVRHHEKFARGFERYMMEGVAPSRGLARVFAQFKDWLTRIYQTVERLKSPITNDIRDVFDRLLAAKPERTVVAPESEPGKSMADIHEADATSTPKAEADKVADNIRSEIDKTITENKTELIHEVKAAEVGGGTAPTSGATGAPEARQPPTERPVAPQEPGAVPMGGGPAQTEGAGAGGATPKSDAIGSTTTDESIGEQGSIPSKPKSELVDKAGNIVLDNLNLPDEVDDVIRETAKGNDDFFAARRGILTYDQQMALADDLGMDAKKLSFTKIGQAFNAEEVLAARKLLIQSALKVRDLMKQAATGSDEDVMAYAKARARHVMIQEKVSGITAEAGRALAAFRKLEGGKEAKVISELLQQTTGLDLFQLKAEAKLGSALDTAQKVSKFVADGRKPSFGDKILEYWINGLISGPATHGTYTVGNTLLTLWRAVPETAAAAVIGKVHGILGHETSGVKLTEAAVKLRAARQALPTAISMTGAALKTGVTSLLPGEAPWSLPFQMATDAPVMGRMLPNENLKWRDVGADLFGSIKGIRDSFISTGALIRAGGIDGAPLVGMKRSPLGAIPDVAIKGVTVLPIGTVARVPGRAIAAIHSFFRTLNYSMEKSAIAYRTAAKEGLDGDAFAARVNDITVNPSEEVMKNARTLATDATLMGRGGEFTQALSKMTNLSVNLPVLGQTKLLKFINPFVHISSNIIEQSLLQRTPLGILSQEMRDNLMGRNGAEARDFAQARMLVGTALAITAGSLAAEGLVSGSGPSNNKERGIWIGAGNQAHSIKIGDTWYDIHRLGPLGLAFSIGADMYEVAHLATEKQLSEVAVSLAHAISQNILDESFMRGPSDLILAVSDSERYGPQYLRNFVSSFIPFSVGSAQVARAVDPYMRQTRTIMDAIKAKIPYESMDLMPRRDVFGEPIPNRDVFGMKGLSSIYESKVKNDPVINAMLGLGVFPSLPGRTIRGVKLDEKQYDDYSRISGQMMKQRLDGFVSQPSFANLDDGQKVMVMDAIIKSSRESARGAIMVQYPDVMQKAVNRKKMIATTGKKAIPEQ